MLLAFTETQDARWDGARERFWAMSRGERDPETASLSVPVFDATDALVGALTMSGPKGRIDVAERLSATLTALLENERRATIALGGPGARYDATIARIAEYGFPHEDSPAG